MTFIELAECTSFAQWWQLLSERQRERSTTHADA